jgi:RimJ/RimL family protein N-acetyltransferase
VAEPRPHLVDLPAELVGPRVLLRPYRDGDAAALWEAVEESRAVLAEWMGWVSRFGSIDDALGDVRRSQARWLLREELSFALFEHASGRYLGTAGLNGIDWSIRAFEIGYWIRTSASGHGYVTEAVQVLTRFAFDHLQASRVGIGLEARNARSRAVPERLGFTLEGCLRNAHPDVRGQPADVLRFSLTPAEYARLPWRVA